MLSMDVLTEASYFFSLLSFGEKISKFGLKFFGSVAVETTILFFETM